MVLQAACPQREACGTTRGRARGQAAKCGSESARRNIFGDARQFGKYRQGYIEIGIDCSSAGPNDACARQKLAFHS